MWNVPKHSRSPAVSLLPQSGGGGDRTDMLNFDQPVFSLKAGLRPGQISVIFGLPTRFPPISNDGDTKIVVWIRFGIQS